MGGFRTDALEHLAADRRGESRIRTTSKIEAAKVYAILHLADQVKELNETLAAATQNPNQEDKGQ